MKGYIALAGALLTACVGMPPPDVYAQSRSVRLGSVSPRLSPQTRRVLANPGKFSGSQRAGARLEKQRADRNQRILVNRLKNGN
jgi:hypothetical protein